MDRIKNKREIKLSKTVLICYKMLTKILCDNNDRKNYLKEIKVKNKYERLTAYYMV